MSGVFFYPILTPEETLSKCNGTKFSKWICKDRNKIKRKQIKRDEVTMSTL
jgi:hypothetical protein